MAQVWEYLKATTLLLRHVSIVDILSYRPDYAIMTNIDFDHPDYFKDVEDVFDAFQEMANNVKKQL